LDNFFKVVSIPLISRVGLRYIDECPIPSKDNETFRSYYNSVFPLDRFNLSDAIEMDFKTVIKKNDYYVRYIESLRKLDDKYILVLDFDGYADNIKPEDCLTTTDKLHELISSEFENAIKEPVKDYMRGEKSRQNGIRKKHV